MSKKNWVKQEVLQAATVLNSSYTVVGSVINVKGFDQLSFVLKYTKGDETTMELKVQFSDTSAFTDAYERIVTDTSAAGVSTILENTFQRTNSSNFELPISVRGWYVRLMQKATGGTPTGTLAAKYRLENIDRN